MRLKQNVLYDKCCCKVCLFWFWTGDVASYRRPNIVQRDQTYNQVSIASAMHLVGDVDGPASVIGDGMLALLLWFEVPDCMVVFWVSLQLLCSHGRHGLAVRS